MHQSFSGMQYLTKQVIFMKKIWQNIVNNVNILIKNKNQIVEVQILPSLGNFACIYLIFLNVLRL